MMQNNATLPHLNRPNGIGEISHFPRRIGLENGNLLLTGVENRVTFRLSLMTSIKNHRKDSQANFLVKLHLKIDDLT